MKHKESSRFQFIIAVMLVCMTGVAHAGCTSVSNMLTCTGSANGASINLPGTGTNGVTAAGTPYPATLVVSGGSGTIVSLMLRLNGYTSQVGASVGNASRNVGILLKSPSGRNLQVMRADGSASSAQMNLTVVLQDGATLLPNPLTSPWTTSGTFQASAYDGGALAPGSADYTVSGGPAMAHSAAPLGTSTFASVFVSDTVNGTWSLYLVDDAQAANISFSSWDLIITFHPASPSTTTLTTACPTTFVADKPFTMTATVFGIAPTGSSTFLDGGVAIGGCASVALSAERAICATSNLPIGVRNLTADYSGDDLNATSDSDSLFVTVLDPDDSVFLDGFEELVSGCASE